MGLQGLWFLGFLGFRVFNEASRRTLSPRTVFALLGRVSSTWMILSLNKSTCYLL